MKEISVQELHQRTAEWVRLAAQSQPIIITENGKPIATLTALEQAAAHRRLPEREEAIHKRSEIKVDSAEYISEMRNSTIASLAATPPAPREGSAFSQ
jgi:prevent-host-death family protein